MVPAATALNDLTHAVDINDVVNAINSATGVNITAKIDGDKLVITDNTGGAGTLAITNSGGTTTASDLGLTAAFPSGGTASPAPLLPISTPTASTTLDSLNDGNGVRTAGVISMIFPSPAQRRASFNVSLNGAKTLGDLIAKINTAGKTAGVSAAISADGNGITLTDGGGGPVTVTALNASLAASDLGILGTSARHHTRRRPHRLRP